jgi:hypothetical protein
MATTDERLDALETRVQTLEELRLAFETRLIGHDHLLQAAVTNDSAHLRELRNLREEMGEVRVGLGELGAKTVAGFDALQATLRRGFNLPDD